MTTGERGDIFRITVAFTNVSGAATDPTTVSFTMVEPDKAVTTYTYPTNIAKTGTGNYYVDWTSAKDGEHTTYFIGTGTVQRTLMQQFHVNDRVY